MGTPLHVASIAMVAFTDIPCRVVLDSFWVSFGVATSKRLDGRCVNADIARPPTTNLPRDHLPGRLQQSVCKLVEPFLTTLHFNRIALGFNYFELFHTDPLLVRRRVRVNDGQKSMDRSPRPVVPIVAVGCE